MSFLSRFFLTLGFLLVGHDLLAAGEGAIWGPTVGERVAFVGNSSAERFSRSGYFEALLQRRFPQLALKVRNFARPGDEVGLRQRPNDYAKLGDPLALFHADTVLCFFGFNESFAGPAGIPPFAADYERFIDAFMAEYRRADGSAPRLILVSPVAQEPTGDKFLPSGAEENAHLEAYSKVVGEVAGRRGMQFVDLFSGSFAEFTREPGAQFTSDGIQTTDKGERLIARLLDGALFGPNAPEDFDAPDFQRLRAAINDKSWVHSQDYRMLNGWYVYGGRNQLDTATFPPEYQKIRAMVDARDQRVWELAQGHAVPDEVDDHATGELTVPKTMFGTQPEKEPKTLRYPSPEESAAAMKVPAGFEVQPVASEREFPALTNVSQINFDNRGRLWAACMQSYPQWKPGDPKPADSLVILDGIDARGRAGKCTVFYDKLVCPTGFEFWHGGVIVFDQPRLLFLRDTDGDDRADEVTELSDGWGTEDTHCALHTFEWTPGGLLYMFEGIALTTTVETLWGPQRQKGKSGCYAFDPRTRKLRHFVIPGQDNPWCCVFDGWGQGFIGDATTSQQHWETPLSGSAYEGRTGLNTLFYRGGTRPNTGSELIFTRQFPTEFQGLFVVGCVINVDGLVTFSLGDDGAGFQGARRTRGVTTFRGFMRSLLGRKGDRLPDDLLTSERNETFRPVDPQIGPDGALYFGDWCDAIISHANYSQRDPNRDHTHGRVFRLVCKNRPLLSPETQMGKSVAQLLDQLRCEELRTRYRARRELRDRPTDEVRAGVAQWLAALAPTARDYDRLCLEALWVQQGHHAVDPALLAKVLRAKTGEARAGATRVLADEWEEIGNAMEMIKPQLTDDFPRTRLEAIRALSFVRTEPAVEALLTAATKPRDYWIDYTLAMSLGALEPVWKEPFLAKKLGQSIPEGVELLNRIARRSEGESASSEALKRYLNSPSLDRAEQTALSREIAQGRGSADAGLIVFQRMCMACHSWKNEGGITGPALDRVRERLPREQIVESILTPSARIAVGFLMTKIAMKNGKEIVGVIESETPAALKLKLPDASRAEIAVADIRERQDIRQSGMPEGLAHGMLTRDFFDLVEFLTNPPAVLKK